LTRKPGLFGQAVSSGVVGYRFLRLFHFQGYPL